MIRGLEIEKPYELEIDHCHDHDEEIIESQDSDASDQFYTENSSESTGSEEEQESEEEIEIPEESNISKTLGDHTTRTVIILVLSLLIMQSVCSTETYIQPVLVHTQAFAQVVEFYNLGENYWNNYQVSHEMFLNKISTNDNIHFPIVHLHTVDPDHPSFWNEIKTKDFVKLEDLRPEEITQILYEADDGLLFSAWYSVQYSNRL
jgi:hypothetical protein